MNTLFFRCLLACVLAGLLACPHPSAAYSFVMMSDEALFEGAEGVIKARVVRLEPVSDGDAETRYELQVLEVLAGERVAGVQTLALPGTFDAPRVNLRVDGVPRLKPGGLVVLFYARRSDGILQASQLSLGVFGLVTTAQGDRYVRWLEGAREFGKRAGLQRFSAPRDPARFERWLRDRAEGFRRAPDYLDDHASADPFSKFTFTTFNFTPPGPARWFQFDSSQTLTWRAGADGQASTVSDEFASLQQALAAWTNDVNSRILLTYGGTAANPGTCNNPPTATGSFSGHTCWNDPAGRIAGSYSCGGGGTLAIGGSFAGTPGELFSGQTWYRRSDAFVVMQDGAGCFMDGHAGADGAEVLTHEVGHALGFGHACGDSESPACNSNVVLDQATMRALAHGDGRGAVLGDDDRAAAAVAYPQPGGDVTPPTIPANLVATTAGLDSINVSWNASSDSGGSGLAGYELERCAGVACNDFAEVVQQASTNVVNTGLVPATTYRYRVRAFDGAANRSGYSNIATATTSAAPSLTNGVAMTGLSGTGNQSFFTVTVPAGATNLLIAMSGGSGEADLYVRFGTAPSLATFDCRPFFFGNNESCSIPVPQAGTYHVMINADPSYSGVNLVASFSLPEACTAPCIFRNGFQ